jgi:ketosteroid isomerase-like protein
MTSDEAQIRELIERFVKAYRAKDVAAVMAAFAPEIVSFDIVPPLQEVGAETFRERWQKVFSTYRTPIAYEIRDLSITVGDGVAFSHSLNRVIAAGDHWLRWTACYRKFGEKWLIVHEHVSVPVDMASGKAMLNLKP